MRTASVLLGIACLVTAMVLALGGRTSAVGTVDLAGPTATPTPTVAAPPPERTVIAATPTATPRPSPTPTPEPAPEPVVQVDTSSARIADLADDDGPNPERLVVPSLDLTVPVRSVGVADDGQMAIPEDVDEAGWYRFGPSPGEAGNAVLAGHVDSREQGLGAFARLGDLALDDVVEVVLDDGTTQRWAITGRDEVSKDNLVPSDLFRRSGPSQLVLVTCGGEFDGTARSYKANVVVVAQPL